MIRQLTIGGATAALVLAVLVIVSSQEKTLGQQAGAQAGSQGAGFDGGGFGGGGFGGGFSGGRLGEGFIVQHRDLQERQERIERLPAATGVIHSGAYGRRGPEDKVAAAQRKLMEADTDEARQAAEKELREALVAEFEADMQRRAEELEAIKKRVAEMEANLAKRTAAKDEIIDLRLEVLIQEAEGLGWTAERQHRGVRSPFDPSSR